MNTNSAYLQARVHERYVRQKDMTRLVAHQLARHSCENLLH